MLIRTLITLAAGALSALVGAGVVTVVPHAGSGGPAGLPDTAVSSAIVGPGSGSAPGPVAVRIEDPAPWIAPVDALVAMTRAAPRAAAEAALAEPGYWHRRDALERVARAWAELDPFAALAFVQGTRALDPASRSEVRLGLLETWAGNDPRAVLGYLVSREGQSLFALDAEASRSVTELVSLLQPYDVIAVAEPLPRGLVRATLLEVGMAQLVAIDLPAAVQRAALAAPGPDRARWVRAIAPDYARQDPAGAREWAAQFEAEFPRAVMTVTALANELAGSEAR